MGNSKGLIDEVTAAGRRRENADAKNIAVLFGKADRILIKKLSNNDRDWAANSNKHQGGVYIPQEVRDAGFFAPLKNKSRGADQKEIREVFFYTSWPQFNVSKQSRLVHYTSKGQETHLTGLPKQAFEELLPASYLLMGRIRLYGETSYECLTIDSGNEEGVFLEDLFELGSDFLIGEFVPEEIKTADRERILDFAEKVMEAWSAGGITEFAAKEARMPVTADLARMAREEYFRRSGRQCINPFDLEAPGDVLRNISRDIEWNLFKEYQRRERSVELVRALLGDNPRQVTGKEVVRILIDKFHEIDAVMLSASQQRKSRAGYSYEHHIEAMLIAGNIPHQKQVVVESKKRPDFILPSLKLIDGSSGQAATGLILSAKTTLRERWKQVEREMKGRRLFLTTVDENIAANAIEDMDSINVQLVVPESLLRSNGTEYVRHKNVISFKQFCEEHIKPHLASWRDK